MDEVCCEPHLGDFVTVCDCLLASSCSRASFRWFGEMGGRFVRHVACFRRLEMLKKLRLARLKAK